MRVFVAGATGAIGRPLISKLIAAGHEVTGLTRSEEKASHLRDRGAEAVVADVFDGDAVREAVTRAGAAAVIHQLTALPDKLDFRDKEIFNATNRLRTEGTRILLDAARAAGARRFIAQSIAFAYLPRGPRVLNEDAPLVPGGPEGVASSRAAVAELERAVLEAEDLEGIVLRYGYFYGPGTHYAADGGMAEEVRKRRQPIVGKGTGAFSFIHVDDAADATVAALERGAPGVYNVVDDDPAPLSEWVPVYAEALGAKKPLRIPAWAARLAAGKEAVGLALQLRGASNTKAKRELGWQPAHPSWRAGFAESLG